MSQTATRDPRVTWALNCLKASKTYVSTNVDGKGSYWDKAQRAAMAYYRLIDQATCPTSSQIYHPAAKIAVDVMLPNVLWWLFSQDQLFDMVPMTGTNPDAARLVRNYMHYVLRTKMRANVTSVPIIKDACKLGVGYGVLEMDYITPHVWKQKTIDENKVRSLEPKLFPVPVPRLRYVKFKRILPSPFGGPTPAERDWVFFVDHMPISQIKAMHAAREKGDGWVDGLDLQKLEEDAYTKKLCGSMLSLDGFLDYATALDLRTSAQADGPIEQDSRYRPEARIPVLKLYAPRHHLWIANADTVIFDTEDDVQTLRNPILKAGITVDQDDWFTEGIIGANEEMFTANNILFNTVVDIVDWISRPRFIRDQSVVPGELNLEPFGTTVAQGDVNRAFRTLDIPFRQETMNLMDRMGQSISQGTGQSPALQGVGNVGIVRGGAGALESLLAQSGIRDKFAAQLLDLTFFGDVVEGALLLEQLCVRQGVDAEFQIPKTDQLGNDGMSSWENLRISYDDLRQNFRCEMTMQDKLRNPMAEFGIRQGVYASIMQHPYLAQKVNPMAMGEYLMGSRLDALRIFSGGDPAAYLNMMAAVSMFGNIKAAVAPEGATPAAASAQGSQGAQQLQPPQGPQA